MLYIYYLLTFLSGTFFGSFLNLVADRVIKEENFLKGRSKCDFCGVFLKPINLIPLFSYIFQKGRCSNCKTKLSIYYPISETISGLLFVLAAYLSQVFVQMDINTIMVFVYLSIILSFYLILFLTDAKHMIIPDIVVIPAIVFAVLGPLIIKSIYLYNYYQELIKDDFGKYLIQVGFFQDILISVAKSFGVNVVSAIIIGLFFVLLIVITKGRGMGGGDIRLGVLIGLVNEFPNNVLAIFLGFLIGAFVSVILVMIKKKSFKDTIAFGPFLLLGSVISLVWGSVILEWYFNLF